MRQGGLEPERACTIQSWIPEGLSRQGLIEAGWVENARSRGGGGDPSRATLMEKLTLGEGGSRGGTAGGWIWAAKGPFGFLHKEFMPLGLVL